MVDLISLTPSEGEDQNNPNAISLTEEGVVPLPPQVSDQRAAKVDFALGEVSPGIETLRYAIAEGNEKSLRQQAATNKEMEYRKRRMELLDEYMKESEGNASPKDVDFIMSLTMNDIENPDTIWEKEYSRKVINSSTALSGETMAKAFRENSEGSYDALDVAEYALTRNQIALKKLEEAEAAKDSMGWGTWAWNLGEQFVPLKTAYTLRNTLENAPTSSILPGNNLLEQIQYLYQLPPDSFEKELTKAVETINLSNPLDTLQFLQAVHEYGSSDLLLDNIFGVVDVADIALLGTAVAGKALSGASKVARRAARGSSGSEVAQEGSTALRSALKDSVREASKRETSIEGVVAATGDIDRAGVIGAISRVRQKINGMDEANQMKRLRQDVPSILNPRAYTQEAGAFSREAATRLESVLSNNAELLTGILTDTGRVTRLTDNALAVAIKETKDKLRKEYNSLNDAIVDIEYRAAEKQLGNTHSVVLKLGKEDATLFDSPGQAVMYADSMYNLKEGSYTVRQKGGHYYIEVGKDIDETTDSVRDALIETKNQTPRSVGSTFLGFLRTPDDMLSKLNRENRLIATTGAQEIHRRMYDVAQNIGKLRKDEMKNLAKIMELNRDTIHKVPNEVTGVMEDRRGYFYQSVGEYQREYLNLFGRNPSEKEAAAYFSYVQMTDMDFVLRNIGIYRDKARQGIESKRFQYTHHDMETGRDRLDHTRYFDGKDVDDVPWNDIEEAGLFVYNPQTNGKSFYRKNEMTNEERSNLQTKIANGEYKVVQIANPVEKPMATFGIDDTVNFVITPSFEGRQLDYKQIPYRPGGHVEYAGEWFVKQPKVSRIQDETSGKTRNVYEGDKSIFNFTTQAEARKFAEAMDQARIMLKNGEGGLDDFVVKNLPYSPAHFRSLFASSLDEAGKEVAAALNIDDVITFTNHGNGVNDMLKGRLKDMYENFEDNIDSKYNLYAQVDKKFAGERSPDLPSVKLTGKQEDNTPIYELTRPRYIDPTSTLNRATANVMRNEMLADYKITAMEHFIEEFADVMKVPKEELRANPSLFLHEPVWDELHPDKGMLAAAKNSRRAILNLLGTHSELQGNLKWVQNTLLDSVYNTFGKEGSDWLDEVGLIKTRDPFKYARSIAFHTKLGLFNPVQLVLQMQTMVHTAALTGMTNATQGLAAATLMRRLALTSDQGIINHIAGMASKMGWKREDFLESYSELKKTGFYNVGGEHAWRDDMFEPKLFKGTVGKALDAGTFFFREGERMTRLTAWNAAFKEWRTANPNKAITNEVRNQILRRTDDLTVNMTRASNADWQQGIWTVPTQFFAYQARIMEQFLGKRLTTAEKARAFGMYSFMYGLPVAAGATTAMWPWQESLKKAAMERGIDLDDNALSKALVEGVPSLVLSMITGNDYNLADRYGPGGLQVLKELANGETGFTDIIFGASGSVVGDILKSLDPTVKFALSVFGDDEDSYPLNVQDLIDASRNISSVNNAAKMIYAMNTGKLISKNEVHLAGADTWDAVFMGITGLTPRALDNAFLKMESMKEHREVKQAASREIQKNLRRAAQATDPADIDRYLKAAKAHLVGAGFQPNEYSQIFGEAFRNHTSLLDQINRDFWEKAPIGQVNKRADTALGIQE